MDSCDDVQDEDKDCQLYYLLPSSYALMAIDNKPQWFLRARQRYQRMYGLRQPMYTSSDFLDHMSSFNNGRLQELRQLIQDSDQAMLLSMQSAVVAIARTSSDPEIYFNEAERCLRTLTNPMDFKLPNRPPPIVLKSSSRRRMDDQESCLIIEQDVLLSSMEKHINVLESLCDKVVRKYEALSKSLRADMKVCRQRRRRQLEDEAQADGTGEGRNHQALYQPQKHNPCSVCLLRSSDRVMIPCCHLAACSACSFKLDNCPICRKVIRRTILVDWNE